MLNIVAICFHGSEGYLGLYALSIVVVMSALPRCSLYPTDNAPRTFAISCPATDQPSHELSVKLWPSSALLWRLSSSIRGLGKEQRKRQLVFVEAKLCLSYCCCQLHDPASGYRLLVIVQLGSPSGVQLESALTAIELLPELYVKDSALM